MNNVPAVNKYKNATIKVSEFELISTSIILKVFNHATASIVAIN